MNLQFSQLSNAEHRREPRTPGKKPMEFRLCRDGFIGPAASVVVRDFSNHGVGFNHAEQLRERDQFLGRFSAADPRKLYTVVHCRPSKEGYFIVGAEFASVVPTDADAKAKFIDRIERSPVKKSNELAA